MLSVDDYARCNTCERDLGNTGTSHVVSAKFMSAGSVN